MSIQELKLNLLEYNNYAVKCTTTGNQTYSQIADKIWSEKIQVFVKNENIQTWEKDIKSKFIDQPYCRIIMSDKQAYCLAKAYFELNAK